jgi:hypothetical protein
MASLIWQIKGPRRLDVLDEITLSAGTVERMCEAFVAKAQPYLRAWRAARGGYPLPVELYGEASGQARIEMSCRFAHELQARSTTQIESTSVPSMSNRTALQVKVNGMKGPLMKLIFCPYRRQRPNRHGSERRQALRKPSSHSGTNAINPRGMGAESPSKSMDYSSSTPPRGRAGRSGAQNLRRRGSSACAAGEFWLLCLSRFPLMWITSRCVV